MTRIRRVRPATTPQPSEPELIPVVELEPPQEQSLEDLEANAASRVDYDAIRSRYRSKITNRKSAIRAFCVECMGGMVYEVAKCLSKDCALFPYRMGEDPNDARTIAAKKKREEAVSAPSTTRVSRARRTRSS